MGETHSINLDSAACSNHFPGANCHLGENIREQQERGLECLGGRQGLEPPPAKVRKLAAQESVHKQEVEDDIEDIQHLVAIFY